MPSYRGDDPQQLLGPTCSWLPKGPCSWEGPLPFGHVAPHCRSLCLLAPEVPEWVEAYALSRPS